MGVSIPGKVKYTERLCFPPQSAVFIMPECSTARGGCCFLLLNTLVCPFPERWPPFRFLGCILTDEGFPKQRSFLMLEFGGVGVSYGSAPEDLDFGPPFSHTDLLDINEFHTELS